MLHYCIILLSLLQGNQIDGFYLLSIGSLHLQVFDPIQLAQEFNRTEILVRLVKTRHKDSGVLGDRGDLAQTNMEVSLFCQMSQIQISFDLITC